MVALALSMGIMLAARLSEALAQAPALANSTAPAEGLAVREPRPGALRLAAKSGLAPSTPAPDSLAPTSPAGVPPAGVADPDAQPARRYRIRDESEHCVVARLHGQFGDKTALIRPDGQLGFPRGLIPTDEPFVPLTAEDLRVGLQTGPFADYRVLKTRHYLILYQSRLAFAEDSARLLENLYRGLIDFCGRHDIPVHEAEFPLVAVIFANERDFRAHKEVDPEVQAYYEIFTNRIFFYQESDRDEHEPKLTALRKPQTVAHEGAHQILCNIGVQTRLSAWPLWLIEGLAEYCATPASTRRGIAWDRPGLINALHMATLRELGDPLSNLVAGPGPEARTRPIGRKAHLSQTESLILKTRLTPTDYAEAWALTHYLFQRRGPDFVRFLRSVSQFPPLQPRTPEEHLAEFRGFFGEDLARLDKKVDDYIRALRRQGRFDPLPYYAVFFEQPLGGGLVRRAATVSQSPQMIEAFVQQQSSPQGGPPQWQYFPYPSKARADLDARKWMRGLFREESGP